MALSEILKEDDKGRLYVKVRPTGFWERIMLIWYAFWYPDRYMFVGLINKVSYLKLLEEQEKESCPMQTITTP